MKCRCFSSQILILLLVFFCLAGCRPAAPTPVPIPATATPTPIENVPGLSADEIATLNSLEKVDDAPLYVMHFKGGYDLSKPISMPVRPVACSLFAAMGNAGNPLYGRNFDWDDSPALLLFTEPPDGYASVSMVDLTFLNISPAAAKNVTGLPLAQRLDLLDAPLLPFDGMNEYGLSVAMAAVPQSEPAYDPAKPTIGSVRIMRQMLDHARDVDEALAIFKQYNIDFAGGPPIHYLLADRAGKTALLEYVDGALVVLPGEQSWHLATNHLRATAKPGPSGCWRYDLLNERLTAAGGSLDPAGAMHLLNEVSQARSTQWSVVYELGTGKINIVMQENYPDVHTFELPMTLP